MSAECLLLLPVQEIEQVLAQGIGVLARRPASAQHVVIPLDARAVLD